MRIVLSELGRSYDSHVVSLGKDEHASEACQRIHPDGLVPALAEDGALFIESIDIIGHLASGHADLSGSNDPALLDMADAAQKDLRLFSFEFLFRVRPAPPKRVAEAFEATHQNDWLRQFRKDFAQGFDPERIDAAIARTDAGFCHLDTPLSDGRAYLAVGEFSINDIALMPNVHLMRLMD